jgi:hypothetical protein
MIQKRDQISPQHCARRLELTVSTAVENLAVVVQHRNGGHTFFERNSVGLNQFGILFAFANVNVD